MSKLLDKPLRAFTMYALIVLACSIPVYFAVVNYIWLEELDEHNEIIKNSITARFKDVQIQEQELEAIIALWNVLQPGTSLVPAPYLQPTADSTYTVTRDHAFSPDGETDRFRGLSTLILINQKPYQLSIETNVEEVDETLMSIAMVTFGFFVILIFGFILLNRRLSREIWKPFTNTLKKLQNFDLTSGNNLHFNPTNIEEFDALNLELQKLIEKNIVAYKQQKTFIENASHELQTPLAVLKSKIEFLLQSPELTQNQSEIIQSIEIPLGRVSRINKNLLLLAKIENRQFFETSPIPFSITLSENLTLLEDYFSVKNLVLEVELAEGVMVQANKILVEILLNNLMVNAIHHAPNDSVISINLQSTNLIISNAGSIGLNVEKVFQRFVIASETNTNSGLGLAIVKQICQRYDWQLSYDFQAQCHIFKVEF